MAGKAVRLGEGVGRIERVDRRRYARWYAWPTGLGWRTHRQRSLGPIDAVWCAGDHLRNGDELEAAAGVVVDDGGEQLRCLCGVRVNMPEHHNLVAGRFGGVLK